MHLLIKFFKNIFYITWTVFLLYLLFCSFDVNTPAKELSITTTNSTPGGELNVVYSFIRTRQCALKSTIIITDTKGQVVFSKFEERTVNGNLGSVVQDDSYRLKPNTNPGLANFDLYLEWECPYNIVHTAIKPITLHYNVPFTVEEQR